MELCEIIELIVDCEHKTAPTQETGYPSIRTPNIGRGHFILDNVNRVSDETYKLWTRREVPTAGDLIMAREAPVGNVAMIPDGIQPCLGQRTVLIRCNTSKVIPRYLVYLLIGPEVQATIQSMTNGVTVPHLNVEDIRSLPLPDLPPLLTQHKIAAILSAYDDLIENNNHRIQILEEMARTLYRHWFVDYKFPEHEDMRMVDSGTELGLVPEGWDVVELGQFIGFQKGKKPRNLFDNPIEGSIPMLLIEGLRGSPNNFTNDASVVLVDEDDVIMVMDGASSGQVFIRKKGAIGSTIGVYRPLDKNVLSPYYMYLFFLTNVKVISDNNTGAAIPHANKDFISRMKMVLPPRILLGQFKGVVEPLFELSQTLVSTNCNLRAFRDLLLPKLVSGELDVSDIEILGAE